MWLEWWTEVLRGKRGEVDVKRDMKAMGIKEEMAQDRCAWRNITGGPTRASADAWNTVCVLGSRTLNEYDDDDDDYVITGSYYNTRNCSDSNVCLHNLTYRDKNETILFEKWIFHFELCCLFSAYDIRTVIHETIFLMDYASRQSAAIWFILKCKITLIVIIE